jgi:hypothetical protein
MKLIDFGLSAFYVPGKRLRVHCGSPSYAGEAAPHLPAFSRPALPSPPACPPLPSRRLSAHPRLPRARRRLCFTTP